MLDIVICEDEDTKNFAAILTCNQEGQTKLLRTELSMCPVLAVRTLVDGLQKDTAKLFRTFSSTSISPTCRHSWCVTNLRS
jgi:hypothetical protein